MQLSPEDRDAVRQLAAERIVSELRAELGGCFAGLIVLPLNVVGPMIGLSGKQAGRRLPITSMGPRSNGVTLQNLQTHLANNTARKTA
jgi:hypothetical protein